MFVTCLCVRVCACVCVCVCVFAYQEEDLHQASVHLLYFAPPPGALPLRLDDLARLQQDHGPVGIGRDVLLDEVTARRVLYILPCALHWESE